jgi:tetrahydromethanopterin S-methyltransferase subunit G
MDQLTNLPTDAFVRFVQFVVKKMGRERGVLCGIVIDKTEKSNSFILLTLGMDSNEKNLFN